MGEFELYSFHYMSCHDIGDQLLKVMWSKSSNCLYKYSTIKI